MIKAITSKKIITLKNTISKTPVVSIFSIKRLGLKIKKNIK